MRLQSNRQDGLDDQELDVQGPSHAEAMAGPGRVSSTSRASGRQCRPATPAAMASHRGAVWRGGAAGEKPEDLVRQKARPRRHHVTAAMAVLVRKVEAQRLQQMKMLARSCHRHIEKPALLVDLLGSAACHIRRNTSVDEVENKDRVPFLPLGRMNGRQDQIVLVEPRQRSVRHPSAQPEPTGPARLRSVTARCASWRESLANAALANQPGL